MEAERMAVSDKNVHDMAVPEEGSTPPTEDAESQRSRKRTASTSLEHSPVKALKSLAGSEETREESAATVRKAGEGNGRKEETLDDIKKKLDDVKKKANNRVIELKDERDGLRGQNAELEVRIEELEQRLKASTSAEASRKVAKRVEDDIKKKYDKKTADLTSSHDSKFTRLRTNFQSKVDELNEEAEDAKQEAKDAQVTYKLKEKDLKKEYADYKKQLKAEQQEEIKKFKPENNNEIKEKKDAIRSYEKRIKAFEHENVKHGEEVGEMQAQIAKDHQFKKKAIERMKAYEDNLRKEKNFALSIGQEYAAKTADLQAKLEAQGRRWEKMRDCCEDARGKLVAQQRSNFVLREANEGLVRSLKVAREGGVKRNGSGMGTGKQWGVEIGTQTEVGSMDGEYDMLKTSEGRKSAETGTSKETPDVGERQVINETDDVTQKAVTSGNGENTSEQTDLAMDAVVDGAYVETEPSNSAPLAERADNLAGEDTHARNSGENTQAIETPTEREVTPLSTTLPKNEVVDTLLTNSVASDGYDADCDSARDNFEVEREGNNVREGLDADMNVMEVELERGGNGGSWAGLGETDWGWGFESLKEGVNEIEDGDGDGKIEMGVGM